MVTFIVDTKLKTLTVSYTHINFDFSSFGIRKKLHYFLNKFFFNGSEFRIPRYQCFLSFRILNLEFKWIPKTPLFFKKFPKWAFLREIFSERIKKKKKFLIRFFFLNRCLGAKLLPESRW